MSVQLKIKGVAGALVELHRVPQAAVARQAHEGMAAVAACKQSTITVLPAAAAQAAARAVPQARLVGQIPARLRGPLVAITLPALVLARVARL